MASSKIKIKKSSKSKLIKDNSKSDVVQGNLALNNTDIIPIDTNNKIKKFNGRPMKYKTTEEYESKINEYLNDESNHPYTLTSLCLFLGICKDTFCEYSYNSLFSESNKRIKLAIESEHEKMLLNSKTPAGIIFSLKNNFGWVDRQEIQSVNVNVNKDVESMSNDDIKEELKMIDDKLNNN